MRYSLLQLFAFTVIFCATGIYPPNVNAQNFNAPVIRDTDNAFYKQLTSVIRQIDSHFDNAKDSLVDTTGQKTWTCKEVYKMEGARSCSIYQRGFNTIYVAFFLSRDSKDALESSYQNLWHQIRDCMGPNYVYKEKKATTADILLGSKDYKCEMTPSRDAVPDQADMLVSVEKDIQTGNYELILEIQKYRGYY